MHQFGRDLVEQGHRVHALSIATPKHPGSRPPEEDEQSGYGGETVFVDTTVRAAGLARNLFRRMPYHVKRFDHRRFHARLAGLLRNGAFDIVQLEGLSVGPYLSTIRSNVSLPVVLRAHNIEHELWKQLAAGQPAAWQRHAFARLAVQLRRFELDLARRVDGIAAVNTEIAEYFARHTPVPVVALPPAFRVHATTTPRARNLFFLGSMEWRPNRDAVKWFLSEIWPLVRERHPDLQFVLGGKGLGCGDAAWQRPGVTVAGEVADARKFMQANGTMVVPMRSGCGVSIKIMQGMALGTPIIATSLAARGLGCRPGVHLLTADTPTAFAEQIHRCVTRPALCEELARASLAFAAETFAPARWVRVTIDLYRELAAA